jgi:hypothetical protein
VCAKRIQKGLKKMKKGLDKVSIVRDIRLRLIRLGNCFVSIPNLKNLPMRLRMSRMIAHRPRIQAIDLLASRLTL